MVPAALLSLALSHHETCLHYFAWNSSLYYQLAPGPFLVYNDVYVDDHFQSKWSSTLKVTVSVGPGARVRAVVNR